MKADTYLFVAGAPRSGTTFLFNLLSQHSKISPHKNGESYFFMNSDHPLKNEKCNYHSNQLSSYKAAFISKNNEEKYLLDGTDHLMYQEEMIDVIASLPRKKMIFILREPAGRVFSSFQFTKNNLSNFKKNLSFKEYIEGIVSNDEQATEDWFYSENRSGYILKRELEYSYYYQYLKKWADVIGTENIFFLQLESIADNSKMVFSDLFDWLRLDASKINFSKIKKNESIAIKYPLIHKLIMSVAGLIPRSFSKTYLKYIYLFFQKSEKQLDEETKASIAKLKKKYEAKNQQLLSLTDFDLTLW